MTLSLNIGNFFNDSSSHALVDELRKRTSEEDILDFEEKFNSKNEKNLHVYICRFLKNRSISRGLASRWLITIIEFLKTNLYFLFTNNSKFNLLV